MVCPKSRKGIAEERKEASMIEQQIACRMREIRKSKGLTLKRLGEMAGISRAMLSRLENNQCSPPIATLSKIAQALDVPIGIFFEEQPPSAAQRVAVTRRGERIQAVRPGTRIGFTYWTFKKARDLHLIEAFVIQHPAVKRAPKMLFDHPGEEFLLVLSGSVEFVIGRKVIQMGPGDAVHFDPSIPHRVQNRSETRAECLVVVAGEKSYARQGLAVRGTSPASPG
jgi:transcriptional regulator with XRE-family HTH domain